jgi:hypothetical protein
MTRRIDELTDDDIERRRLTVAEYFLVWEDGDDDSPSLREQLNNRRQELRETYLDVLPTVPISRCPFSREVLERAIDVIDLDGLYWEAKGPSRPPVEDGPSSLAALAGAVRLGEPVAWAPFLAKPGPEVPYVRPDVLSHEGVVAVISQIDIGPHTGYPIAYFLDPVHGGVPDELRLNEWGSERFRVIDERGAWRWGAELDDESIYDYHLEPWVESEKVQWIAPGDEALEVRTGLAGCPYVQLSGHRAVTRIEEGDVWWPEAAAPSSLP